MLHASPSSHAPSRQCQITDRFTGHCRTVGPQYGKCFVSPFWRQQFDGGLYIFGKFVEPWSKPHPKPSGSLPHAESVIYLWLLPPDYGRPPCEISPSFPVSRKVTTAWNFTPTFVALCSTNFNIQSLRIFNHVNIFHLHNYVRYSVRKVAVRL
jgi:hypothetical protein